jgi:arylsulfatase A-like enzyme
MGEHGLILKGPLHYRGLIRVPFLWSDPERPVRKAQTSEVCGSLDIARTFLDRAGLAPYNGIQGQSLLAITERGERSQHDGLIVEQTTSRPIPGYDQPIRVRSFVDRDWRLTLWPNPAEGELYNVAEDSYEMVNLWHDAKCEAKKTELIHRMLRKTIELQDWAPLQTQEA